MVVAVKEVFDCVYLNEKLGSVPRIVCVSVAAIVLDGCCHTFHSTPEDFSSLSLLSLRFFSSPASVWDVAVNVSLVFRFCSGYLFIELNRTFRPFPVPVRPVGTVRRGLSW